MSAKVPTSASGFMFPPLWNLPGSWAWLTGQCQVLSTRTETVVKNLDQISPCHRGDILQLWNVLIVQLERLLSKRWGKMLWQKQCALYVSPAWKDWLLSLYHFHSRYTQCDSDSVLEMKVMRQWKWYSTSQDGRFGLKNTSFMSFTSNLCEPPTKCFLLRLQIPIIELKSKWWTS